MKGYSKKINKYNEPLILEKEDWTAEEYKVLLKVFGCPKGATRIKVTYKEIEWLEERAHTPPFFSEPVDRRKVLISDGMSNDFMLILTDAPKDEIEKWCRMHNQEMENGENTFFDILKKRYYVNVLFDSEVDDKENIEAIGYDEQYDLNQYTMADINRLTKCLEKSLLSCGYEEYILQHIGDSIDVVRHGGCLIDLDNIVHLEEVLGFNVSYELYSYIDSQYDDSLLEIEDKKELMKHVWKYIGR